MIDGMSYKASVIADLIDETDIDYRGNLFMEIAIKLRGKSQHATASMFEDLAYEYGIR